MISTVAVELHCCFLVNAVLESSRHVTFTVRAGSLYTCRFCFQFKPPRFPFQTLSRAAGGTHLIYIRSK